MGFMKKQKVEEPAVNEEFAEPKKQELNAQDTTLEELTNTLKRIQAEFENHKKRVDKEVCERINYANAALIQKLLPVLDSFDEAVKHKDKLTKEELAKGIDLIHAQLTAVLQKEGLKAIEAEGKHFDYQKNEALMTEHNPEKEDGIVLEEFQKGYLLKDLVLRTSKVKVNDAIASKKEEKKEEEKKQNNGFN